MGPGDFPTVLGVILVVMGAVIAFTAPSPKVEARSGFPMLMLAELLQLRWPA